MAVAERGVQGERDGGRWERSGGEEVSGSNAARIQKFTQLGVLLLTSWLHNVSFES